MPRGKNDKRVKKRSVEDDLYDDILPPDSLPLLSKTQMRKREENKRRREENKRRKQEQKERARQAKARQEQKQKAKKKKKSKKSHPPPRTLSPEEAREIEEIEDMFAETDQTCLSVVVTPDSDRSVAVDWAKLTSMSFNDPYFEERLRELIAYRHQHGNCMVPISSSPDGPHFKLGVWVAWQRVHKRWFEEGNPTSSLSTARIDALDTLDFEWDPYRQFEGALLPWQEGTADDSKEESNDESLIAKGFSGEENRSNAEDLNENKSAANRRLFSDGNKNRRPEESVDDMMTNYKTGDDEGLSSIAVRSQKNLSGPPNKSDAENEYTNLFPEVGNSSAGEDENASENKDFYNEQSGADTDRNKSLRVHSDVSNKKTGDDEVLSNITGKSQEKLSDPPNESDHERKSTNLVSDGGDSSDKDENENASHQRDVEHGECGDGLLSNILDESNDQGESATAFLEGGSSDNDDGNASVKDGEKFSVLGQIKKSAGHFAMSAVSKIVASTTAYPLQLIKDRVLLYSEFDTRDVDSEQIDEDTELNETAHTDKKYLDDDVTKRKTDDDEVHSKIAGRSQKHLSDPLDESNNESESAKGASDAGEFDWVRINRIPLVHHARTNNGKQEVRNNKDSSDDDNGDDDNGEGDESDNEDSNNEQRDGDTDPNETRADESLDDDVIKRKMGDDKVLSNIVGRSQKHLSDPPDESNNESESAKGVSDAGEFDWVRINKIPLVHHARINNSKQEVRDKKGSSDDDDGEENDPDNVDCNNEKRDGDMDPNNTHTDESLDDDVSNRKTGDNEVLSNTAGRSQKNLSDPRDESSDESESAKDFSDAGNASDDSGDENATENKDCKEQRGANTDLKMTDSPRWDLHYQQLKLHMSSHYPDGGFVVCCKCGKTLGNWVKWQRYQYGKKILHPERVARLEDLGFLWDDITVVNEAEKESESDPESIDDRDSDDGSSKSNNDDSDFESNNDAENELFDAESYEVADSDSESSHIGSALAWNRRFYWLERHMKSFYPDGGYVAASKCPSTQRRWIFQQRYMYRERQAGRKNTITAKEIQRLENLGFWWEKDEPVERKPDGKPDESDPVESDVKPKSNCKRHASDNKWDMYFNKLKNFMKKHGIYETGGFVDATWCKKGFSNWVIKQRDDYRLKMLGMDSDITNGQIEKLESIGFHWRRKEDEQKVSESTDGVRSTSDTSRKRTNPQQSRESNNAKVARKARCSWDKHFEKLCNLEEQNDDSSPYFKRDDQRFYNWCRQQRHQYRLLQAGKKSRLTEDKVQRLKDSGFLGRKRGSRRTGAAGEGGESSCDPDDSDEDDSDSSIDHESSISEYDETSNQIQKAKSPNKKSTSKQARKTTHRRTKVPWETHYEMLVPFMKKHCPNGGFVRPPTSGDKKFYNWVCIQRSEYRKRLASRRSELTDDRLEKLERLGFKWEVEESDPLYKIPWETHYEKLVQLMKKQYPNGGFVRPNPCDKRFYSWVCIQRSEYRKRLASRRSELSDEHFEKLKRLGFKCEQEESESSEISESEENEWESEIEQESSASSEEEEGEEEEEEDNSDSSMEHESSTSDYDENSNQIQKAKSPNKKSTSKQARKSTHRHGTIPWESHYEKLVLFMKKHCPNGGFVRPPTSDVKFYNWVCSQRSAYRKRLASRPSTLTDDRLEKLERLGFKWKQEESESSEVSESEEDKWVIEIEQESSASSEEEEDEDDSEQEEDTDSLASSSGEEDGNNVEEPGREERASVGVTKRKRHGAYHAKNASAYESMGKRELLRLCMRKINQVELLKKEKVALQSNLKAWKQRDNSKLMKSKNEQNQLLRVKIKNLQHENQKLMDENFSLTQCNDNLRRSHKTAMLEERAHIQRETKRRKLAEDHLEKAKQLIPMELDRAMFL